MYGPTFGAIQVGGPLVTMLRALSYRFAMCGPTFGAIQVGGAHLDLGRAPYCYGLYGVKYIG